MPTPHAQAQRHWWLRMMLTGASQGGDAASAVYGTILAASILITVTADAFDTFLAVIVTGIVFWLAHVHVAVTRRVIHDKQHIGWPEIRRSLIEEWPLVQASISPAAPLVLAMLGLIGVNAAIDLGLVICLAGLFAWGIVVSRIAHLTRRQTAIAVLVNVGFGVLLVILKSIIH